MPVACAFDHVMGARACVSGLVAFPACLPSQGESEEQHPLHGYTLVTLGSEMHSYTLVTTDSEVRLVGVA